ncbi:hypothetical protein T484DRAFT_1794050 [Baffinella frigidus]|nr:hypothetical protein T484DRAFT_1794050 [Cryptophyta sp. CCMP2293]
MVKNKAALLLKKAAASGGEPAASEASPATAPDSLTTKVKNKTSLLQKKATASGGEPAASEADPADSEATGGFLPPSLSKRGSAQKKGPPPADYRCAACSEKGHWVFDCSQRVRKLKKKKKREADEEDGTQKRPKINFDNPKQRYESPADVARAQAAMPIIKLSQSPECLCGKVCSARKNRDAQSPCPLCGSGE